MTSSAAAIATTRSATSTASRVRSPTSASAPNSQPHSDEQAAAHPAEVEDVAELGAPAVAARPAARGARTSRRTDASSVSATATSRPAPTEPDAQRGRDVVRRVERQHAARAQPERERARREDHDDEQRDRQRVDARGAGSTPSAGSPSTTAQPSDAERDREDVARDVASQRVVLSTPAARIAPKRERPRHPKVEGRVSGVGVGGQMSMIIDAALASLLAGGVTVGTVGPRGTALDRAARRARAPRSRRCSSSFLRISSIIQGSSMADRLSWRTARDLLPIDTYVAPIPLLVQPTGLRTLDFPHFLF